MSDGVWHEGDEVAPPERSGRFVTISRYRPVAQHPDGWGAPIPPERQAELKGYLQRWAEEVAANGGQSKREGPFAAAADEHRPGVALTGADVFFLAACAAAGGLEADTSALAVAQARLLEPPDGEMLDLSPLHVEGAYLSGAHLEGANLYQAHLERANLQLAHLESASFFGTHLEGVSLYQAHLERAQFVFIHVEGARFQGAYLQSAYLPGEHLEGVGFEEAHLESAVVYESHLDGANLERAHLEHADFSRTHLSGANLTGASFDKASLLNDAVLTGASFDQAIFDNTNLTVVDWSLVQVLGDERAARVPKDKQGKTKSGDKRLTEFKAAVRANRVLAVALQAQGLTEDAGRFAYRAQVLQRQVLRRQRKVGSYLFSLLIAALSGYGYRLWRILVAYGLALVLFAAAYFSAGQWLGGTHLAWYQSFLVSLTAIHGRVFFSSFGLDNAQSWVAAVESVVGIVIEGVFVAMLIQRFFGR